MESALARELDRIHDKLEALDNKLDDHLARIAKVETQQKGLLAVMIFVITTAVERLADYFM